MNRSKSPEIATIAAEQWGMVSAAQAAIVGVNARVLSRKMARGELERLAHGIYRLAGTPPSPHDNLRAAWIALAPGLTAAERIAAGPTEVGSHRSAALLHSLGDLDADLLEFTTSQRRQTRRDDIRIHRGVLNDHDWTLVDGLPTTTVLRTIHDLARSHTDRGHLASAVRDALLHYGLPVNQVETVLEPFARSYGISADSDHRLLDVLLNETGVPQTTLDIASRIHTPPQPFEPLSIPS